MTESLNSKNELDFKGWEKHNEQKFKPACHGGNAKYCGMLGYCVDAALVKITARRVVEKDNPLPKDLDAIENTARAVGCRHDQNKMAISSAKTILWAHGRDINIRIPFETE